MAQALVDNAAHSGEADLLVRRNNGLLTTMYSVNASKTKRIVVELDWDIELNRCDEYVSEGAQNPDVEEVSNLELLRRLGVFTIPSLVISGSFVVSVKLTNAALKDLSWKELVLTPDWWSGFKDNFPRIESYFKENDYQFYDEFFGERCVRFERCELYCGSSYGSKAVVVSVLPKSMKRSIEVAKAQNNQKLYIPSITMQKVTFDGIKNLTECVDSWIELLNKYLDCINMTKDFVVSYLKLKTFDEPIIKIRGELLKNNSAAFKEFFAKNVNEMANMIRNNSKQLKLNETYVNDYLNLVLNEFVAIYHESFAKVLYLDSIRYPTALEQAKNMYST